MPSITERIPSVHKNVWYVHPYAGGPGIGRFSRAFYLAQNWRLQSIRTTILTPTFHHLMDAPQVPGEKRVDDVSYHFIDARAYSSNGLARLRNMAEFSFGLLRDAETLVAQYGIPDAIIGSSPHPYMFLAVDRLARRFNAASIFEVRDLWPLSLVELADVSPYHPLVIGTGWVERYAYRHADQVVSLHPASKAYMCERGADPDRWHYIPNGVDAQEEAIIEPDEPAYRRLMQWHQEGKFVALYAGALGPPNNIDILVRAAAELRSRGSDRIRILIVGRGEVQQQIADMVSDLGLEEHVAIYPQVPKFHAIGLMQNADVGYISLKPKPIFMHGVSPNKLHDYMLAKLPIVSAMRVGNDSVTEAGCGLTVEPGDPVAVAEAFIRLADMDRTELQEMGERGLAFVRRHHDYAALAKNYAELF